MAMMPESNVVAEKFRDEGLPTGPGWYWVNPAAQSACFLRLDVVHVVEDDQCSLYWVDGYDTRPLDELGNAWQKVKTPDYDPA